MKLLKHMDFRQVTESHCKAQNVSNLANSNYDLTSRNQHYILFCIKEKEMDAMKLFH